MPWPQVTDSDVIAARPPKNKLNPWKPYAFLVEPERSGEGVVEDVLTIFLTNRECPFHCAMCDLWKNTLDDRVPAGAIPNQIDYATSRLPAARHIKLYNAGNFFDPQAIPPQDHHEIANRLRPFQTVIVENHPRLTDERCLQFRDRIETRLEIALGLETVHPEILPSLNKRMTVADYDQAVQFLKTHDVDVRTFILLKPPGLNEADGIDWALRSIRHAVNAGSGCLSLIPTRPGNGLMDQLQSVELFSPPTIRSMEAVLEQGLEFVKHLGAKSRVFMDVWDAQSFFTCIFCGPARAQRIQRMNLSQQIEAEIHCEACRSS